MKTDIEIANSAYLERIEKIAEKLGVDDNELEHYGHYMAKVPLSCIDDKKAKQSNLILVTAISPTKAGIGKTTVSISLALGLNEIGKKATAVLREPSLGPCFGIKGGACGGGYAQVLPMDKINLHFTGDFHAVTTAHNMITALMDNYFHQHKETVPPLKQVLWKRVMDVNDRNLRHIITGLGPAANGIISESGFDITPASEIMAILCLATDIEDLRRRIDNILLGYRMDGSEFTLKELGVTGSIVALLKDAFKPNLVQTTENTPAIIHGGPFANIAHGCNTIVATKLGLSTSEYAVTEAGFGADLGAEKFIDIKCRKMGIYPKLTVLVATTRGLKLHGGVPEEEMKNYNPEGVKTGLKNLDRHVRNLQMMGQSVLVVLNRFAEDHDDELQTIITHCKEELGVNCVINMAFTQGGKGAVDIAKAVVHEVENNPSRVVPDAVYSVDGSMTIRQRIEAVCKKIYHAEAVEFSGPAHKLLAKVESDPFYTHFPICIAKTQYSFTDMAKRFGCPEGFTITIREIVINRGSEFIVAIAGDMMRMPGLPKEPAAKQIDVIDDKIVGLS